PRIALLSFLCLLLRSRLTALLVVAGQRPHPLVSPTGFDQTRYRTNAPRPGIVPQHRSFASRNQRYRDCHDTPIGWHVVNNKLVWIDCEMTGLDPEVDALIEVAALVTDFELNVLGDGVELVIKPPTGTLAQMSDVVRTMHTESGLLSALEDGVSVEEAEKQ